MIRKFWKSNNEDEQMTQYGKAAAQGSRRWRARGAMKIRYFLRHPRIRHAIHTALRYAHAPRMLYGYRCPITGRWLPRTRMSSATVAHRPHNILLENNVYIGHYAVLDGTARLTIREGVQITSHACIWTHSSHDAITYYRERYMDVPEAEKENYHREPVTIEEYAFVGAGAVILPGVTIGRGAVIGAGAIITRDVAPEARVTRA